MQAVWNNGEPAHSTGAASWRETYLFCEVLWHSSKRSLFAQGHRWHGGAWYFQRLVVLVHMRFLVEGPEMHVATGASKRQGFTRGRHITSHNCVPGTLDLLDSQFIKPQLNMLPSCLQRHRSKCPVPMVEQQSMHASCCHDQERRKQPLQVQVAAYLVHGVESVAVDIREREDTRPSSHQEHGRKLGREAHHGWPSIEGKSTGHAWDHADVIHL